MPLLAGRISALAFVTNCTAAAPPVWSTVPVGIMTDCVEFLLVNNTNPVARELPCCVTPVAGPCPGALVAVNVRVSTSDGIVFCARLVLAPYCKFKDADVCHGRTIV